MAPLHLAPAAGKPTNREKTVGGGAVFNLASEYSVPGASSARCASSRTNWNLLPPPHCRAERSQAPHPATLAGPAGPRAPCSARSGRRPRPAPAPGAGWAGGGSAARPGLPEAHTAGGARRRIRRRVGAEPAAPAPTGRPRPPPVPLGGRGDAAARRPRARRVRPLVSRASGERRPASPPHPEMHGSRRAEWKDFSCRGPVTWPGAQVLATASLPNPVSFPPNPLSAGDGFLLFLVRLLAGLGVPPRQERVCARPQAGPSPQCGAWRMQARPGARGRNAC